MQMPLVTIGIPCYNCGPYLPILIRSIQAQSYPHWEAIAIDDGSSDDTAAVLKGIEDPRFRVILDRENRGLPYRLNQIADLAQGDLVARTDADDIMLPDRIARQVDAFLKDPRLDVCCSGLYVVDNRNRLRGLRRLPETARSVRAVMLRNGPSHPTVMTTHDWALHNRYRCEYRRGEDLDLWIRTIETSRILTIPEPLHIVREDVQFDDAKYQRTIRDHQRVVRHYLSEIRDPAGACLVEGMMFIRKWVYTTATMLGLANQLAARRNRPVPPEEGASVTRFLASIVANPNPA